MHESIAVVDKSRNTYINFGFCVKSIDIYNYSRPHLLGFTRISIDEIVQNKMQFGKRCQVVDENQSIVGYVHLRIQLGERHSIEMENMNGKNIALNKNLKLINVFL